MKTITCATPADATKLITTLNEWMKRSTTISYSYPGGYEHGDPTKPVEVKMSVPIAGMVVDIVRRSGAATVPTKRPWEVA